jgi:hypothetical protein
VERGDGVLDGGPGIQIHGGFVGRLVEGEVLEGRPGIQTHGSGGGRQALGCSVGLGL